MLKGLIEEKLIREQFHRKVNVVRVQTKDDEAPLNLQQWEISTSTRSKGARRGNLVIRGP